MDADTVNFLNVVFFSMKLWHDLLDGFEQMLGCNFANGAFINT